VDAAAPLAVGTRAPSPRSPLPCSRSRLDFAAARARERGWYREIIIPDYDDEPEMFEPDIRQ
jgi:hypothetical protein